MTTMRRLGGLAAATLLAAGCSTQKIHQENHAHLAAALTSLDSGNLPVAEVSARQVLIDSGDVAPDYPVQRFFAQYLLARIHMQAAFGGAFLTEMKAGSAASLGGGPSTKPSPVGHLVATSYHSSYGLESFGAANGKPLVADGTKLVPEPLEALGTVGAGQHLQLCLLTVYSRLQFEEQVNEILKAIGVSDLASLDAIVASGAATPHMKPWIYRAMWQRLAKNNPREAFKFAVRALESAEGLDSSVADPHTPLIDKWMTESERFAFVCPDCDKEIRPTSPVCKACRGPERMDFVYVERVSE